MVELAPTSVGCLIGLLFSREEGNDTWRTDPLLSGDSVKSGRVLCGFAPRLYDPTDGVQFIVRV
jgi:hypothetical protein